MVFLTVGLISISTGALNWVYAHDPNYTQDGMAKLNGQGVVGVKMIWREMKLVMCVPTFLLIVMQVSTMSKNIKNISYLKITKIVCPVSTQ